MIKELDFNNVAILPKVDKIGDRVTIAGAAIIKDYKLIGYLNEIENRALAFIKKQSKTRINRFRI